MSTVTTIRLKPGDAIPSGVGKVRFVIRCADLAKHRVNPVEVLSPEEKQRRDREAIQAALAEAHSEREVKEQAEGQVEGEATGEEPQRSGIPKQSPIMEAPACEALDLGNEPEEGALQPIVVQGAEADLMRMVRKFDIDPKAFLQVINSIMDSPYAHLLESDD